MHLSKKKKTILIWTIPAALIATTAIVAIPTVVLLENDKREIINNSENFTPTINPKGSLNQQVFSPLDFSKSYFDNSIATSSTLLNLSFSFSTNDESQGKFKYDSKQNTWVLAKGNDKISYRILSCRESKDDSVILTIKKSSKGFVTNYETKVPMNLNDFATEQESQMNFLSSRVEILMKMFNNLNSSDIPRFFVNDVKVDEINKLTSSSQLSLQVPSNDDIVFKGPLQVVSGENTNFIYEVSSKENLFDYNFNSIKISAPVVEGSEKLIFSAIDAYKGLNDTSTPLYAFLKKELDANHLAIPSSIKGDDEIQRINNYIFNSSLLPATIDGLPLDSMQALLIKVEVGNSYTWMVAWSNYFAKNSSIVDYAPELKAKIVNYPTWEELSKNLNYIKVEGNTNSSKLAYKAKKVRFDEADTYKTKAIVTIEISSLDPQIQTKKTYEQTITTGFRTKAYVDMEKQINKLIPDGSYELTPIVPTVTIKDGKTPADVFNNYVNLKKLNDLITITPPQGLTDVVYVPKLAILDGTTLTISFNLASINDENNYWSKNGTIQVISVQLNNIAPSPSNKAISNEHSQSLNNLLKNSLKGS